MNAINMPSSIRSYHFSLGIAVIALLLYLNPATAIAQNHMAKLFETALQGEHRTEKQRARDVYRHPEETLLFFGLEARDDCTRNSTRSWLVYCQFLPQY